MDNGPDREVSKLEDVSKSLPGKGLNFLRRGYRMGKWIGNKAINFYQNRKKTQADRVKRELVGELLAKDPDGKITQLLRKKPEWNKYLQPEPKGIFSRILDLTLRRKSQSQAIANPRTTSKASMKTKQSFLEELLTKDKDATLSNMIKNDPQLTNYLENPKKEKTTPIKVGGQAGNITTSQPLNKEGKKLRKMSDISSYAVGEAARENAKLRESTKSLGRIKPKPLTRRNSMPNVSLGGR